MRGQSTRTREQPPVTAAGESWCAQQGPSTAINKYIFLICKSRRQWRNSVSKTKIVVLGNLTTEATSQHLRCILLVGRESLGQTTFKVRGLCTYIWLSGSGMFGGHLKCCSNDWLHNLWGSMKNKNAELSAKMILIFSNWWEHYIKPSVRFF